MSADDKTKLNGIAAGANAYTHPSHTAKSNGLYKITVDSQGHVSEATAVAKTDITSLGIPAQDTTYGNATTSAAGLMSSDDKTKLNGIAAGAEVNQNAFSNVKVGSTTVAADSKTDTVEFVAGSNVTITPDATNDKITIAATDTTYSAATQSAAGLMSSTDKTKLDGVATGAEVNQNTFSNVKVGDTTVAADTKTDTIELVAGSNVTLTPDATNDKVTIAAKDTTYSSKAAASGGTDVSLVTTGEKYTWNSKTSNTGTVTKVSTGAGLTGGDVTTTGTIKANLRSETKLTNASAAATETAGRVYPVALDKDGKLAVNVPWTDNNTTALGSMTGTLAVNQGGTGGTTASAARTNLDVYSKSEVDTLLTSGASFKGTLGSSGADYTQAQLEATSYKAGWYWVVKVAGTYVGQACEAGDMVYAIANKGSAYAAANFSVVQNNIVEMTVAEVDAICV